MEDPSSPSDELLRMARAEGYAKGLNVALMCIAILVGAQSLFICSTIPRFKEVIDSVGTNLSQITIWVLLYPTVQFALLTLLPALSIFLTLKYGKSRSVIVANLSCLVLLWSWQMLANECLSGTLRDLIHGLSGRHH